MPDNETEFAKAPAVGSSEEALANLLATLSAIPETRSICWIAAMAVDACKERIRGLEEDAIRHRAMYRDTLATQAADRIAEYRKHIWPAIAAFDQFASWAAAEHFGEQFGDFLKSAGLPPTPPAAPPAGPGA